MNDTEFLDTLVEKLKKDLNKATELVDSYLTDLGDMKILDVSLLNRKEKEEKIQAYVIAKQHKLDCESTLNYILENRSKGEIK